MKHLLAFVVFSLTLLLQVASAQFVPPGTTSEPPRWSCCECKCTSSAAPSSGTSSSVSFSEGNLTEVEPISKIGSTLSLDAIYNSYNADGSRTAVDTVMGFGWTHSYNIFLFSQAGVMFRFDGYGRVTRYGPGPDGTFISSPGYFETLTQSGGVFTITQKDQTKYNFTLIPDTPFMVSGRVYRLVSIVDRNHNTTTQHGEAGGFAQVFGLHPAIAVVTIAVDSFGGGGIMGLWASFWRSCFPCRWAAFGSLDARHHLRRIWLSGARCDEPMDRRRHQQSISKKH